MVRADNAAKATNVYRVLRSLIGPWCKDHGLQRTPGTMPGWYTRVGPKQFLTFWIQASQEGWDPFVGSKFTLEFQRGAKPNAGSGTDFHRIAFFLTDEQLELARSIQNQVIGRLRKPKRGQHPIFNCTGEVRRWYESKFHRMSKRFTRGDDLWLRCYDTEDARRWGEFLLQVIPNVVLPFAKGPSPRIWSKGGKAVPT